uniref:Variant surface glycoprotein 1625 n=1 Tax=Trypanosoma brucei TaxID=5691 RepID=M4TC24_9TRYP|nr:variant surface glycoprotein 1625 [Trypanosoma brucei]
MQTQNTAGKRGSYTLKVFFLLAPAFRTAEQATDTAAANIFCMETWYPNKLKERLQLRAQKAGLAASKASEEARMFNLTSTRYALASKDSGYSALSVVATTRATALAKEVPAYLHLIETALVLLAERQGNLKYIEALQNDDFPKGASGSVTGTAPKLLTTENSKTCSVTQTITFKMTADCETEKQGMEKAEPRGSNAEGWSHILVRGTSQVAQTAITTVAETIGTAVNRGSAITAVTSGPDCGDAASAGARGTHTNSLGLSAKSISLKYAAANIQVQPAHSGSGSVHQRADRGNDHKIQLITADDSLRHALLAAVAAPIPSAKKVTTDTLATPLSDPTITNSSK